MMLNELIARLEREPPEKRVKHGFNHPHSWRGSYEELAFEPADNVTVGSMLADARRALGTTYSGWKGGEYTMHAHTECYMAKEGTCGGYSDDGISLRLLEYMLADEVKN